SVLRHLHFVQALDALRGGGLGTAVLELHDAMRQAELNSTLVTTSGEKSKIARDNIAEFHRLPPSKFFFALGLNSFVKGWMLEGGSTVVHGHGFYVYPNAVIGRLSRRYNAPLVYHPHGMLEPWVLRRSPIKKRIAHLLYENANFT